MVSLSQQNKRSNGFNYLLFGADTTGTIMCWNLSLQNYQTPIYVINGHSDIIYDLKVFGNRLFSVSHDHHVRCLDVGHFPQKVMSDNSVDYVLSRKLFKDDSKYPLRSIVCNSKTNEVIFGSRKVNMFKVSTLESKQSEEWTFGRSGTSAVRARSGTIDIDLDHIQKLKLRSNLLMVQRTGKHYVKVFDIDGKRELKKYQVEADCADNETSKYRIYDAGISHDGEYSILCVGSLAPNVENIRSSLKGFRIPKPDDKY